MALPKAPEEREYGAVQEDENLDATAPPPIEPTPAQADEESLGRVEETMEEAIAPQDAVAQPEQQPRQPTTQRPSMWRIPHRYDTVLGTQSKKPRQAVEDIGMFWEVLANSTSVDPSVQAIARAIMGGT